MTERALRREARNGLLVTFVLANKEFTTGSAIKELIRCLKERNHHGSASRKHVPETGSGSSGTQVAISLPDVLRQMIAARRKLFRYMGRATLLVRTDNANAADLSLSMVMAAYLEEHAPTTSSEITILQHMQSFVTFWGHKVVSDVNAA